MPDDLVLAIDQGTSSTKCLLLTPAGEVLRSASVPVPVRYPRPGWVEQDAGEILDSVLAAASQCLAGAAPRAVGLSTQRESAVVWDRRTGRPAGPVLGWQDRRAVGVCDGLRESADTVREISGLPLDPMFSAAKLRWLLDRAPGAAVGTVDAWLLYALTGEHRIEVGNASRTQLLDLRTGAWSPSLLGLFGIPASALPAVVPSSGDFGRIGPAFGPLAGLPITAVLGDSHAALYAHGAADGVKVTYGTGSSVMRLGEPTDHRVCTTIAWTGRLAMEGNIRSSGSTVTWLAGVLGCDPARIAELARGASSDGVHLVPAFGGLAAPWWDDAATGTITGLTLATGPAQLARAAIESIAHQVTDVVDAMNSPGLSPGVVPDLSPGGVPGVPPDLSPGGVPGVPPDLSPGGVPGVPPDLSPGGVPGVPPDFSPGGVPGVLLADGGAAANDELMQIQADLAGVPVRRARTANLSALGAGFLAAGCPPPPLSYDTFRPRPIDRAALRSAWRDAVARARTTREGSRS